MSTEHAPESRVKETRLLLVTIVVSVGVLLLLARFRFPDQPVGQAVESAPAPLERLAARAAYDELASVMSELERRIAPRVATLRVQSEDGRAGVALGPRLAPDRAVALLAPDQRFVGLTTQEPFEVLSRDPSNGVVVIRVPAVDDSAVTVRAPAARPGPRFVAVLEHSSAGPILKPVYVGRMELTKDGETGGPLLVLHGLQPTIAPGSAIFSLDAVFLGLVRTAGETTMVVPADALRSMSESGPVKDGPRGGSFGIELGALTPALARATSAKNGAVVVHVTPGGPNDGILQDGDVIQMLDGAPVMTPASVRDAERGRSPGSSVSATVIRRGSPLELMLRIGESGVMPAPPGNSHGFAGRNVSGAGIEVVKVETGGSAARAGLQRGDLIVSIDGEPARDLAELTRRYRALTAGQAMLLGVVRPDGRLVLALEKP
jgi:hypothetical protein